jgi:predicted GTPase
MNDDIKQAIQNGIQQAQQPLLDRIAELERIQESDSGYIWKLNALVDVLMQAFPVEHAETAVHELQERLDDYSNGGPLGFREMDVVSWQKRLAQLAKPPRDS